MNENLTLNSSQEKPAVELRLAGPEDWRVCKELRLLQHSGNDAGMFGVTPENRNQRISKIEIKNEEEWKKELSDENIFIVLPWVGSEVAGIGSAKKREIEKDWYIFSGYVKENFRSMGIGKKMFAARLEEIRKRGGVKVMLSVKAVNATSIQIAEFFGFKKREEGSSSEGFYMELKDVNNSEVIKKIEEVLNER